MKRMTAEIFAFGSEAFHWSFGCFAEDGVLDEAVTYTLFDLIEQASWNLDELERLAKDAQIGRYASPNPNLPDWGYNDTVIWLTPPVALSGHVCIANENTKYSSDGDDHPQQFTFDEFWTAVAFWRNFMKIVSEEGKAALVGRRFEASFP